MGRDDLNFVKTEVNGMAVYLKQLEPQKRTQPAPVWRVVTTKRGRHPTNHEPRLCPDCGCEMDYDEKHHNYECPNQNCKLIEVRIYRNHNRIIRGVL